MVKTPLGSFLKRERCTRGLLRPGQLARLMRPGAPPNAASRLGSRIRDLEEEGCGDNSLLAEVVRTLGISREELDSAIADKELFRKAEEVELWRRWSEWADQPVRPSLVLRVMPAVYISHAVPDSVTTLEHAETLAAAVVKERHMRACLIFNRRLSVWFDECGATTRRTHSNPYEPNQPFTKIGNKRVLFSVGSRGGTTGKIPGS